MNTKYSVFKFPDQVLKKFYYDFNGILGWLPYVHKELTLYFKWLDAKYDIKYNFCLIEDMIDNYFQYTNFRFYLLLIRQFPVKLFYV